MKSNPVRRLACLLVATIIVPAIAFADTGGGSTGGGDLCEKRIQDIRDDIREWIVKGGAQNNHLQLPANLAMSDYAKKMTHYMTVFKEEDGAIGEITDVECVHAPVKVQGHEKVCRFDSISGPKITCYYEAFMDSETMSIESQYQLIHHEYAGLSGIEVPNGSQSNYPVSDQISAYLEVQTVKKLAVMKAPGAEISLTGTYFGVLNSKIDGLPLGNIEMTVDTAIVQNAQGESHLAFKTFVGLNSGLLFGSINFEKGSFDPVTNKIVLNSSITDEAGAPQTVQLIGVLKAGQFVGSIAVFGRPEFAGTMNLKMDLLNQKISPDLKSVRAQQLAADDMTYSATVTGAITKKQIPLKLVISSPTDDPDQSFLRLLSPTRIVQVSIAVAGVSMGVSFPTTTINDIDGKLDGGIGSRDGVPHKLSCTRKSLASNQTGWSCFIGSPSFTLRDVIFTPAH